MQSACHAFAVSGLSAHWLRPLSVGFVTCSLFYLKFASLVKNFITAPKWLSFYKKNCKPTYIDFASKRKHLPTIIEWAAEHKNDLLVQHVSFLSYFVICKLWVQLRVPWPVPVGSVCHLPQPPAHCQCSLRGCPQLQANGALPFSAIFLLFTRQFARLQAAVLV